MNLRRLVSLLTSPLLAITACPGVCGCAWVVCSSICICYMTRSVPPSASASTISVLVSGLSPPPSLCLWLYLGCLLLYLFLLSAWVRSFIYVCVYCMFVPVPGLSAPPSASVMSVAVLKSLKNELINVAFLDSLGNHIQAASYSRSMTCSIACPIALLNIYGLYRAPELVTRISGVKCRKSGDNISSQDARRPSTPQILEMRSGRRRPSLGSVWWRGGCRENYQGLS